VSRQSHQMRSVLSLAVLTTFAVVTPATHAFDFGHMMNPSRWMNGNDRNDEPYVEPPPPPPGPYGYGTPPYGAPGLPAPPGYQGVPTAAPTPPAAPVPPTAAGSADKAEIEALKRRIEELESRQPPPQQPPANAWPSAPAFRPMNQD
jgi:hypothetical protein